MGLTIHYHLQAAAEGPRPARDLVARLHARALTLPLARVGNLIELRGPACDCERYDRKDANRWLLIQARQLVEDHGHSYPVSPRHLIAFATCPGKGCEPANFGLCEYPRTLRVPDPRRPGRFRTIHTGLSGWQWDSFCKTQYAADPECGGVANFLRCHVSVVALLEQAQALGILAEVSDETGFWQQHDVEALVRQVSTWDATIAARIGPLQGLPPATMAADIATWRPTNGPAAQPCSAI